MTKRIRRHAPEGAQCYSTRSGRYLRVGDDESVSYWDNKCWMPVPGLVEDDLWAADCIIWLDGRDRRFLWVSAFVMLLGVTCIVMF